MLKHSLGPVGMHTRVFQTCFINRSSQHGLYLLSRAAPIIQCLLVELLFPSRTASDDVLLRWAFDHQEWFEPARSRNVACCTRTNLAAGHERRLFHCLVGHAKLLRLASRSSHAPLFFLLGYHRFGLDLWLFLAGFPHRCSELESRICHSFLLFHSFRFILRSYFSATDCLLHLQSLSFHFGENGRLQVWKIDRFPHFSFFAPSSTLFIDSHCLGGSLLCL